MLREFFVEKRVWRLVMTFLLLFGMFPFGRESAKIVAELKESKNFTVVIDAGHGGDDPGKVGVHNEEEKVINLQIAKLLQKELEYVGIRVVMTRETDADLADEDASNKKRQSLQRRCELAVEENPDCVVSIHQNSYTDASVKGAQVFYYSSSEEGKRLAEILQQCLVEEVDPENHRLAKGNNSYYLLKKMVSPTVIVECGFLSNPEEARLLSTEEYQKQIAKAIAKGIEKYLREE